MWGSQPGLWRWPSPAWSHRPRQLVLALACSRCARSVTGSGRWSLFATSCCQADPSAVHLVRAPACHDLTRCTGGWYCTRCRLAVSSSRRAAAARTRCPILTGANGAGVPQPLTMGAYCANLAAVITWRSWWSSPAVGPPAPAVPLAAAAPPRLFAAALVWRPHWVLASRPGSNSNVTCLCLRCGAWGTRRTARALTDRPCPATAPVALLRGAGMASLLAGIFGFALYSAPLLTRDRAIFLGWRPVASGTGPA
jgi:hypothetical protein